MIDVDSDDETDNIFDTDLYLNRFEKKGGITLSKHGVIQFFNENRYPFEKLNGWLSKIKEPKFQVEINTKGSFVNG